MVFFVVKSVLIQFPDKLLEQVDALVREGHYCSRSEVLRTAARREVEEKEEIITLFKKIGEKMRAHYKGDERTPNQIVKDIKSEMWNEALEKAGGNKEKAIDVFFDSIPKFKIRKSRHQ